MTGVTKLTKLSVFSGLNHLTDLSMDSRFATLLGYTPGELDGALSENVEDFGRKNGMDFAAAKSKILDWYDGYRFSPKSKERVCMKAATSDQTHFRAAWLGQGNHAQHVIAGGRF